MIEYSYDVENRLVSVSSGEMQVSFVYDGDGQRVASVIAGAATVFIGEVFEWEVASSRMRRYYYAGAQNSPSPQRSGGERVGVRVGSAAPVWLLGDHLGSTSVAANIDGSLLSRQGYLPWGELRFAEGSLPGRYQFTGQASYEAEFGLYFFKARWYDPHLGRFSQPDSIVPDPGNPLDWDRYQYARANPLKYTDPTGHFPWLLIPILVFIATIPGDTGLYEVDAVTSAVGDAALRFVDPIDAVFTGVECLQGQCTGEDILFAILPVVNGGLDDAADAARIAAKEAGIVETTGQLHHVFSQKIMTELNKHDTLKGGFERNDLLVQALDKASHNGYQTWHREYDDKVVRWLKENDQATSEEFLSFILGLYSQTESQKMFLDADQLIQMAIEEIK